MKSHFLPVADLEMSMFVCSARARIFAEGLRVQSRTAVLRNFCQTSAVTESSAQIYRTDVSDTRYTGGRVKNVNRFGFLKVLKLKKYMPTILLLQFYPKFLLKYVLLGPKLIYAMFISVFSDKSFCKWV